MSTTVTKQQAEDVCNEMLSLLHTYKVHLNQIAEENGLTPMQLFAMRTISDGNNATGKIAQILHCDASNVTGIMDRLLSLEFATRQEDTRDRRVKTVQLTKKGEAVLQKALASIPERFNCASLTQQEAESFSTIIGKLNQT